MNQKPYIPTPSKDEVEKYLVKWRQLEKYFNQELALNKLFFDLCPKNDNIEDICCVLILVDSFVCYS